MVSSQKIVNIILKLTDDMSGGLNKASSGLKSFGDNVTKIGTSLTTLTAPLALAGATGVKMAMDLDREMRNIQSISKATDAEIATLSDTFIDMSTDITKTTDSAINLASAFYDIQGSGFEGADAMKVLEAATQAATAGLTQTQTAATGITAVLNSYGMSAEQAAKVSDLMFQTVNLGVGSFEELSGAMSNVVGLAATLDVPFETVSAALATMSKQGMSFSEASVAMNQAMSNLLNPTREGAEIITKMGYASGEAMVQALGFDGALQAIAEHTGGSATEMGKLFSNTRSMRAALALTGNGAQMFAEDMAAMGNATGAAGEAFAIQSQSFEAQFKNFQNNLNAMLIEIGQILLPIINDFLQNFLLPMIQAFRGLPEPIQKAVVIIGALVTILGPLLIIIGSIISAIGSIGAAVTALGGVAAITSGVMTGLGAAFALLTSPIGLLIASLVALKIAWDTNFLGLRTKIQEAPSIWRKNFDMLAEIVRLGTQKLVNYFMNLQQKVADYGGWKKLMTDVGKNIVMGLITGITSMVTSLVNTVKNMASKASSAVKNAFGIHSPSALMKDYGEQIVKGFNLGLDSFGGIGVTTPQLAPAGASPTMTSAPIGGGFGGNGGTTIIIQNLHVPLAENKAQIDYIADELGKRVKRRGVIG